MPSLLRPADFLRGILFSCIIVITGDFFCYALVCSRGHMRGQGNVFVHQRLTSSHSEYQTRPHRRMVRCDRHAVTFERDHGRRFNLTHSPSYSLPILFSSVCVCVCVYTHTLSSSSSFTRVLNLRISYHRGTMSRSFLSSLCIQRSNLIEKSFASSAIALLLLLLACDVTK